MDFLFEILVDGIIQPFIYPCHVHEKFLLNSTIINFDVIIIMVQPLLKNHLMLKILSTAMFISKKKSNTHSLHSFDILIIFIE